MSDCYVPIQSSAAANFNQSSPYLATYTASPNSYLNNSSSKSPTTTDSPSSYSNTTSPDPPAPRTAPTTKKSATKSKHSVFPNGASTVNFNTSTLETTIDSTTAGATAAIAAMANDSQLKRDKEAIQK
jgi:hypothetical protein